MILAWASPFNINSISKKNIDSISKKNINTIFKNNIHLISKQNINPISKQKINSISKYIYKLDFQIEYQLDVLTESSLLGCHCMRSPVNITYHNISFICHINTIYKNIYNSVVYTKYTYLPQIACLNSVFLMFFEAEKALKP